MRFGRAHRVDAMMVAVVEAQPPPIAAGNCEVRQDLAVDGWPSAGYRHGVGGEGGYPWAQPRREDVLQLGQRAQRGLFDPADGGGRGGAQPDRDSDGLLVVKNQRR